MACMNWTWKWVLTLVFVPTALHAASLKTENLFLITSDGLRWQEVFDGAEERLITAEHGGVKINYSLRSKFWRDTPESRRETLLPFFLEHDRSPGAIDRQPEQRKHHDCHERA